MSHALNSDVTMISIEDQSIIKVLNYKKILHYNNKEIRLLLNKSIVVIQGTMMHLIYFDKDEVRIEGHICSVVYQNH